jgi:Chalcone isomerase-like
VRLLGFTALLASMSVVASAAEVAGIKLDERTKIGTCELVLNGAGLRRKVFFRIYVAGLYLTEKRTSPADVLALPGPKRASITLMRSVPARELADALKAGIRENSSPQEHQAVKGRVDELAANLAAMRQCKKGDVIMVDWLPDVGTLVVLNGEVKGNPIPGYDVYSALLRVWLGDRPSSASLKKALLGQTD